ncbi:hypothetical protein LCGC14_2053740 [marine sediment metagenome]|uniref:Uncharacterized protein n=1 Tax=marine sediment metagenome TaxID=412755 RepID=A0A0F9EN77_9ZZZZ
MVNIKISWINETSTYQVEKELDSFIDNFLSSLKQYLKLANIDIILIPFGLDPGFQKTLMKHRDYFQDPNDINNLDYIEDGFAVYIPNTLLKNRDLCLIVVKVYKFMRVSILHELYHLLFENDNFKRTYLPRNYVNEGPDFSYYLEDFFVEYLALEKNINKIFNEREDIEEYQKLNELTDGIISKSLQIYNGFKNHGGGDLKGLLISLLSCYYIFFSCWRVVKKFLLEHEIQFKELWDKILGLKELEFFKKILVDMRNIFIEENLSHISNKLQILFNQL